MAFNKSACIIRKIYCGEGRQPRDTVDKKYSRAGTTYECLKRGFGIADWTHRKKSLGKNNLQQIPYVGEVYSDNFKKKNVKTIENLISKVTPMTAAQKQKLIGDACKKANGVVDQKAVNSVLLFLHERGVKQLPKCAVVQE